MTESIFHRARSGLVVGGAVSALTLAGIAAAGGWWLAEAGSMWVAPLVGVALLTIASSVHARSGAFKTASAALLVSSVWITPWTLWAVLLNEPGAVAYATFLAGVLMTLPLITIVASASKHPLDVLRPSHWDRQFADRGNELIEVYLLQAGGVTLAAVLFAPLLFATIAFVSNLTLFAIAAAVGAVLGCWSVLAGRLAAAYNEGPPPSNVEEDAAPAADFSESMSLAGPAIQSTVERDMPAAPPVEAPVEPQPEESAPQETEPQPQSEEPQPSSMRTFATPEEQVDYVPVTRKPAAKRTPILDAERRVEEAMKRFRLDPSYTLSKLSELDADFAPSPHVKQSLAICLNRTGHHEQAIPLAREAFKLCFEHGHISLAAALFFEMRNAVSKFSLKTNQVLEIAAVLEKAEELAAAAKAYSLVIHSTPDEFRAIKGLLDVADRILSEKKRPAAAAKVYQFLLEHCAASGYAELMRDGIRRCEEAEQQASALAGID